MNITDINRLRCATHLAANSVLAYRLNLHFCVVGLSEFGSPFLDPALHQINRQTSIGVDIPNLLKLERYLIIGWSGYLAQCRVDRLNASWPECDLALISEIRRIIIQRSGTDAWSSIEAKEMGVADRLVTDNYQEIESVANELVVCPWITYRDVQRILYKQRSAPEYLELL